MAELCEPLEDYLQTDAYSGYNFTEQDEAIFSLGCLAHARRSFADLARNYRKKQG